MIHFHNSLNQSFICIQFNYFPDSIQSSLSISLSYEKHGFGLESNSLLLCKFKVHSKHFISFHLISCHFISSITINRILFSSFNLRSRRPFMKLIHNSDQFQRPIVLVSENRFIFSFHKTINETILPLHSIVCLIQFSHFLQSDFHIKTMDFESNRIALNFTLQIQNSLPNISFHFSCRTSSIEYSSHHFNFRHS
jgi:hypothetical protein